MNDTAVKRIAIVCFLTAGVCCAGLILGVIAGVAFVIWLIFGPLITGQPVADELAYLVMASQVSFWCWPLTLAALGAGIFCCVRLRGKKGVWLAIAAIVCSFAHLAVTVIAALAGWII